MEDLPAAGRERFRGRLQTDDWSVLDRIAGRGSHGSWLRPVTARLNPVAALPLQFEKIRAQQFAGGSNLKIRVFSFSGERKLVVTTRTSPSRTTEVITISS